MVIPFQLSRIGTIMAPAADNRWESQGVLNPASARGPDGRLYLFPRLVASGNYSRIGIARVIFDEYGDPVRVERLGIALEPESDYEKHPGGGGCEDPRITFVEPLNSYVMTYTAFSSKGPRIALAISENLFHWQRMGLATFVPYKGLDFNDVDNKDAVLFPIAIPDPDGNPSLAMIHRPLFPGTHPHETVRQPAVRAVDIHRESMWISYCPINTEGSAYHHLRHFESHHRLACPVAPWERLKIGCGAPPVLTRHGWLLVYHGVSDVPDYSEATRRLHYSAGVMVLSNEHPRFVLYRSPSPVLTPELPKEREGFVANVVFPTAIDKRTDLCAPDRMDVYYGMADSRIGVARLEVPETLTLQSQAAEQGSNG